MADASLPQLEWPGLEGRVEMGVLAIKVCLCVLPREVELEDREVFSAALVWSDCRKPMVSLGESNDSITVCWENSPEM